MLKKIKNFFVSLFGGIKVIDQSTFDKLIKIILDKGNKIYLDIDVNKDGSIDIKELISYIKKNK